MTCQANSSVPRYVVCLWPDLSWAVWPRKQALYSRTHSQQIGISHNAATIFAVLVEKVGVRYGLRASCSSITDCCRYTLFVAYSKHKKLTTILAVHTCTYHLYERALHAIRSVNCFMVRGWCRFLCQVLTRATHKQPQIYKSASA